MVTVISRAEWGARAPRSVSRIDVPTPDVWIHHTASEQHGPAGVRAIQAFHMDTRGWSDIAYSFLVDDDGAVYEGRGFGVAGGHTKGHNTTSHAICFMGHFDNRPPTDAALASARALFWEGVSTGQWSRLTGGHRDASGASTSCPGEHLVRRLGDISKPLPTPDPTPVPPPKEFPEMFMMTCPGKPTRLVDGPSCPVIGVKTAIRAAAQGVITIEHEPEDYDARIQHHVEALGRHIVAAIKAS